MNLKFRACLAALVLPLSLSLSLQSGSCRGAKSDSAGGRNASAASVNANGGGEGTDVGQRNKKPDAVKQGTWGGRSVGLEVTGGGARVEFDCAHGSINRKLTLDAAGRFEVEGTLVAERGGPVREGEQAEGQPARYSGRVEGASMTLTVTLTDTKETIGTFNLAHGKAPTLTKCL